MTMTDSQSPFGKGNGIGWLMIIPVVITIDVALCMWMSLLAH